jgi:hypothetical protein
VWGVWGVWEDKNDRVYFLYPLPFTPSSLKPKT